MCELRGNTNPGQGEQEVSNDGQAQQTWESEESCFGEGQTIPMIPKRASDTSLLQNDSEIVAKTKTESRQNEKA